MPVTAEEVNQKKHAPAVEGVLPVIHNRWSARAFDGRTVSRADLYKIFEAVRWAPSSSNEQPWRFLVGERGSETHAKIAASLAGFNQAWAPKAPVLVVGLAHTKFERNGNPNTYAHYDLGAAAMLLTLEAAALGLTTHQMGGFDRNALRMAFGIPEEWEFGSVVALGYQGDPALLGDETLIQRELAPRTRKGLEEIVFSAWGEPAHLS